MNKKLKGSLTVFYSLIMVAVMTLMFTMAELVRVNALIASAKNASAASAESAFSEFNVYMWKNYHLLGVDLGYEGTGLGSTDFNHRAEIFARNNVSKNLDVVGAYVEKYGFLTDESGKPVVYEGVRLAKDSLLTDIRDDIMAENNIIDMTETDPFEAIANGISSKAAAEEDCREKKRKLEAQEEVDGEIYEPQEVEDNPFDAFERFKEMLAQGVVGILIQNPDAVSNEVIELSGLPSKRQLRKGTNKEAVEVSEIDKVFYGQYLLKNCGYYGSDIEHDSLKYEIEYILSGKPSDVENLSAVCNKLLLIREGINIACIMSSPTLKGEADAMAMALTGGNPAFKGAVEVALIAAWAYVESILEVRALLVGDKVAIVKDQSQWNSNIKSLSSVLSCNHRARNVDNGISYQMYLRSFVATTDMKILGIRTCDIIEDAMSKTEENINVRLDNTIYKGQVAVVYDGKEFFYSLIAPGFITNNRIEKYQFTTRKKLCY